MNQPKTLVLSIAGLLLSQACFATTSSPVYVAANGVDSASCGASISPCRTITRALAIAPSGGSVAVGPGVYGDVYTDAQLSGPEEEPGTDFAVINITKPVKLYSTQGAAVTTIEGGYSRPTVVQIDSSNVTFGGQDAGFTITGSSNAALVVDVVDRVSIIGNVALNNSGRGFVLFSGGIVQATDNYAVSNGGEGFLANAFTPGQYVVFTHNVAIGNSGSGFQLAGANAPHQMTYNSASNNNTGIDILPGPSRVNGNILAGNNTGILFDNGPPGDPSAAGPTVTRNTIIASRATGVNVFVDGTFASPKFRENNILGTVAAPDNPTTACGVTNRTSFSFDARNNYWGAASGPGQKPADTTCQGSVLTTPFATKPFAAP